MTVEAAWGYWLWFMEYQRRCIYPGRKSHTRRRQGQCRECWAELINKVRDEAESD